MYFCTWRLFSPTTLFFQIELDASAGNIRFNITAEVRTRFVRRFHRTDDVTKGSVRTDHPGVHGRLSLPLNVSYYYQCNRTAWFFDSMLRSRSSNGRSMAKDILRCIYITGTCRVRATYRLIDPLIRIFNQVRCSY